MGDEIEIEVNTLDALREELQADGNVKPGIN